MGFSTLPITVPEAQELIACGGEVVSASKCCYFDNTKWLVDAVKAEVSDDSDIVIFTLANGDFVEFSRAF